MTYFARISAAPLYPATKWAAERLAETLDYQIAPFGIDLTILEPDS